MRGEILGLHHVSTICGPAWRNVGFYTRLLGLRLVKKTVNFDAPNAYHLYYGDRIGRPGTLITFFPDASNRPGVRGAGEVDVTHLAVPRGSLRYWWDRLVNAGVSFHEETICGGKRLAFTDDDHTRLTLVETDRPAANDDRHSDIDPKHAITGLAAVSIVVNKLDPTAAFLQGSFGFRAVANGAHRTWFAPANGDASPSLEVVHEPAAPRARLGFGSVHHVAWRVADSAAQLHVRETIADTVVGLTDVRDRNYFQSIYFREPGGTIFEIATDGPGFTVDEDETTLGTALKLPPQFEPHRATIQAGLPSLEEPQ